MTERKLKIDAQGAFLLTGFSLLLGFNQVVIKVSNGGLQPVFQAGLRSVLGLVFLGAWIYWRKVAFFPRAANVKSGILIGLLFAAEFVCLFLALDYTSVAHASIMFYSMPIWLAVAAHFLLPNERLTLIRTIGLVIAMAGMSWSILSKSGEGIASYTGDFLALLAAFGWGGIALAVRLTNISQEKPETQLFIQLLISAPLLLLASFWFGDWVRELTLVTYLGLFYQSFAVVSFGFLLWFWIMTIYPASSVASFSFLSPVFAVFMGWLVLGEEVNISIIGALVCVALGLVLINRK